jgi:hypothetical protein
MSQEEIGKLLLSFGAICGLVGLLVWLGGKYDLPFKLFKLPGDIHLKGDDWSFHFPLTTCILLSVLLSLLWRLINWLRS